VDAGVSIIDDEVKVQMGSEIVLGFALRHNRIIIDQQSSLAASDVASGANFNKLLTERMVRVNICRSSFISSDDVTTDAIQ
jgi:hypothetical protein